MIEQRLKHVCEVVDARAGSRRPPLLAVSIHRGVVLRQELTDDQPRADDLSTYRLCASGDIVLNRMRAFQGAIGMAPVDGLVSPDYLVLRARPHADARYLHYLFRSSMFVGQMIARLRGIGSTETGMVRTPRINGEDLFDIRVRLPDLDDQRALADYLDRETARIDALIAAKRQVVELLAERWRAFRDDRILCSCDPLSGSGVVPSRWQTRNLGATVTLQRGHDLPSDSRVPGAVPVVSSGGISGWHSQAACQPPGVVTGRYGTIGDTHYVDVPYWPLNTTLFVSDFRGNYPRWVYHMLAALPLSIDAEKSAVTGINRNVIGALKVPVPPPGEQREIARRIDAVRARSEAIGRTLQTQIELLQERRQALVTAAVTGQIAVPVAA